MGCHPMTICMDHQVNGDLDDPFFKITGLINSDKLIQTVFKDCIKKQINLDDTRIILRCIEIYYIFYKMKILRRNRADRNVKKNKEFSLDLLDIFEKYIEKKEDDEYNYYLSVCESASQIILNWNYYLSSVFIKNVVLNNQDVQSNLIYFINEVLSKYYETYKQDIFNNSDNFEYKKYGLFQLTNHSLLKSIEYHDNDPTYIVKQGINIFNNNNEHFIVDKLKLDEMYEDMIVKKDNAKQRYIEEMCRNIISMSKIHLMIFKTMMKNCGFKILIYTLLKN